MVTLTEALLTAIEAYRETAPSSEAVDAYMEGWTDGAVFLLKRLQEKNEAQ